MKSKYFKNFEDYIAESVNEKVKVKKDVNQDFMSYHIPIVKGLTKSKFNPINIEASSDDSKGNGNGIITFVNRKGETFELEYEITSNTKPGSGENMITFDIYILDSNGKKVENKSLQDVIPAENTNMWLTSKIDEIIRRSKI